MKKYEFTNETMIVEGHTLYRIRALKDFLDVKTGNLGGWIEGENNLSQTDNCWIYNDAKVYDKANISEKACIYGNAIIKDNAKVYGMAAVKDFATVTDMAAISGQAEVEDYAEIHDKVKVMDFALIKGHTCLTGKRKVCGYSILH